MILLKEASHYSKMMNLRSLVYRTNSFFCHETDKDGSAFTDLRSQIGKILASSPHVWMSQASVEDALSQFFKTNSEAPSAKEW